MTRYLYPIFLLFLISFVGCMRGELPVPVHQSGNVTTAMVDMDSYYKYQVYFSLKDNAVVGKHEKTIWDIGFTTSPSGYEVILNGAKSMFAMATNRADFSAVSFSDTVGFAAVRRCDAPNGALDSTAIGDWRVAKPIYIIDRGFDEMGVHQGWVKLQILSADTASYTIRAATLGEAGNKTFAIERDSMYHFSFFSFTSFSQISVQPPRHTWDIVFTQYTHIFTDQNPPITYLVTGCLLNYYNTFAYIDTTARFSSLAYTDVQPQLLTQAINTIGYNWKTFTGITYTVNPDITYVIRTAGGVYYKLHFIGFYNSAGIKGSPQWEYQQL